jgi:hypothetical protein
MHPDPARRVFGEVRLERVNRVHGREPDRNADGHRKDGDKRERRILHQHPHSEPHIDPREARP